MTILYPPTHEGPTPNGYRGNEWEWNASQLKKNDVCWFRRKKYQLKIYNDEITDWTRGTFILSYDYDGIIARVYEDDPDDLITHSLFLGMGDQITGVNPNAR